MGNHPDVRSNARRPPPFRGSGRRRRHIRARAMLGACEARRLSQANVGLEGKQPRPEGAGATSLSADKPPGLSGAGLMLCSRTYWQTQMNLPCPIGTALHGKSVVPMHLQ